MSLVVSLLCQLVVLGTVAFCAAGLSSNESAPGSQTSTDSAGTQQLRPIDKGLRPLYVMTRTFLDIVQPRSRGYFLEDSRFIGVFTSSDFGSGLSAFQENVNDWQFWARRYIGFSVCVAFGLVFIVLLPIIGLIVCSCRCAGRCGGATRNYERTKKHDGCRRASCSLFLLLLTTLITAGVVCAFVTNQLIHDQTIQVKERSNGDQSSVDSVEFEGVVSTLKQTLSNLQIYQRTTVNELQTTILSPIQATVNSISAQLHDFPSNARNRLSSVTNSEQLLNAATALANSLDQISQHMSVVSNDTSELQAAQRQLNDSLTQSQTRILTDLQYCTDDECTRLKTKVSSVRLAVDFNQFENISTQLANVQNVIDNDFRLKIEQAKQDYANISDRILHLVESTIHDDIVEADKVVNNTAKSVGDQVQTFINRAIDIINKLNLTSARVYLDSTVAPKIHLYGNYRYYVCVAVSCMLLLIVTFLYLGLCFGACGDTISNEAGICNRGFGARLLLAGVAFTFLFAWLLMTAVVVLFVTGGATYTEMCRPIEQTQPPAGLLKAADWLLDVSTNREYNLSLTYLNVIQHCQANDGLYTALNLDRIFNVAAILDNVKTDVHNLLNSMLAQVNSSMTDDVNLLTPEVAQLLTKLTNSGLNDINFTSFDVVLSSNILTVNLSEIISDLNSAAARTANPWVKVHLMNETANLQAISDNNIKRMNNLTSILRDVLQQLRSEVQPQNNETGFTNRTQDLIFALNSSQSYIKVNGSAVIQQYVRTFVDGLYNSTVVFLSGLLNQVERRIGQCRPLYTALQTVTSSVCQTFLNPFNGFWFSIGWCLAFSMPAMIVSVHLSTLYRATDKYSATSDNKSYDDAHRQLLSNMKSTSQLQH